MRRIYLSNSEHAARLDDVLLLTAAVVATAVALAVALIAIDNSYVLGAFAAAGLGACVVWSFRTNEARRDLRESLDDVWDVSVGALGENGFLFGETAWDGATEGRVRAGEATVVAERHPGGITRVRVRVGALRTPDNLRRAGLILESISARLDDRRRTGTQ